MGPQATRVGVVRLTMLTIPHGDGEPVPAPQCVARL